jgi:superfamily I DNA and/or RNA helicase
MHKSISAFPNREIYRSKLRDGAGTSTSLDSKFPGLRDVLIGIQAQHGVRNSVAQEQYFEHATDDMARLHWIEAWGRRRRHPSTKSINVAEHVKVFFDSILPPIQAYFMANGKNVQDHVMIICAYSWALHEYQDRITAILRSTPDLTFMDMPRVLTVDASQGQEAPMVIFDGSAQFGNVLGKPHHVPN